MGNTVVAIPSESYPLAATDLYQVFDTSDVPAGVINIVTGDRDALAKVLAAHDDLDGVWYFGGKDGSAAVEKASIAISSAPGSPRHRPRLGQPRAGRRRRVPAPGDPGEEHLGAVRGVGADAA